jgi:hypothetical protein
MKFTSTFVTFGLAAGAIATSAVQRRDGAAIGDAIAQIALDIAQFDSDVNAYTGGPPTTIQSDSDKIVADTNTAIDAVHAVTALSEDEVGLLITPIQNLNTSINTAITDLIAKKDLLVAACAGDQTLDDLNQQLSTATALSNGVVAIVPSELQEIAGELAAPILAAINLGIAAFTGADSSACTSTTTTSASSTTSTSSPTDTSTTGPTTTTTGEGSSSTGSTGSSSGNLSPTSSATPPYTTGGSGPNTSGVASGTGCPPGASSGGAGYTYPTYPAGSSPTYPAGSSPTYSAGGNPTYPAGGNNPTYPAGGSNPYSTGGSGSPSGSASGGGSTPPPFANGAASNSGPFAVVLAIAAVLAF